MIDPTISHPIYEYARLIDAGDFAGVAELFRHGEIITAQGGATGYDEVLAMYTAATRLYEDGTPRTRHLTTNLDIRQDGDSASCQSYFTVMQSLPDFPLQAIISGRYCGSLQNRCLRHSDVTSPLSPDWICHLYFCFCCWEP